MAGSRCAVLGSPVGHSLSPVMHRAAYARLGLDWTYDAIETDVPALAGFLDGLDDAWRGLSLTAPLKRAAMHLVDEVDDAARAVGGLNTIVLGGGRRVAANTDVPGAAAALAERGLSDVTSVRIVGGGATAASVAHAVVTAGARDVEVLVRDVGRADEVRAVAEQAGATVTVLDVAEPVSRPVDLLVSTVPVAAVAERADELVAAAAGLFDVVYDPWPTALAQRSHDAGLLVASGLDLLAHQAVLQVRLMTGGEVPVDVLRDAAQDALD